MITLEEARLLARTAHAGQIDKAGRPYHEHVEAIAELLAERGHDAQIAGLLHDTIEDTDLTPHDLRAAGVPERVVQAVLSVTRRPGETYMDMIHRAALIHKRGEVAVELVWSLHSLSIFRELWVCLRQALFYFKEKEAERAMKMDNNGKRFFEELRDSAQRAAHDPSSTPQEQQAARDAAVFWDCCATNGQTKFMTS